MLNLKCYVRLNHEWRSELEAVLISFVPAVEVHQRKTQYNTESTSCGPLPVNTDCIVKLETFDKDRLYQVPLECVRIVDKYEKEE